MFRVSVRGPPGLGLGMRHPIPVKMILLRKPYELKKRPYFPHLGHWGLQGMKKTETFFPKNLSCQSSYFQQKNNRLILIFFLRFPELENSALKKIKCNGYCDHVQKVLLSPIVTKIMLLRLFSVTRMIATRMHVTQ